MSRKRPRAKTADDSADRQAPAPAERADTTADARAVEWLAQRQERAGRRQPPAFETASIKGQKVDLRLVDRDQHRSQARLCHALGTASFTFALAMVNELANAPGVTAETGADEVNLALAFIAEHEPNSETETLLLAQAWMTHRALVRQHRILAITTTIPTFQTSGQLVAKLGNLFVREIEALAKFRTAGRQVIEVQHVHVYPGGQAVVGAIHAGQTPLGGGGGSAQNQEQAHAVPAALQDLRREDALWPLVPELAGSGEVALPDARRGGGERGSARAGERQLEARPVHQRGRRGASRTRGVPEGVADDAAGGAATVTAARQRSPAAPDEPARRAR
jgi:hypothetical protein